MTRWLLAAGVASGALGAGVAHASVSPSASASADAYCSHGDGVLDITLYNNDAANAVQFVVTNPVTSAVTTVDVAPSDAYAITLTGLADGPITVPIRANGADRSVRNTILCDVAQGDPSSGGRVENHLPATGVDPDGGLLIAAGLVISGAIVSLASRRRHTPADPPAR